MVSAVTAPTLASTPPVTDHSRGVERRDPDSTPDFWVAIVAGEAVWSDPDEPVTALERLASVLELIAFAWCVAMLWSGWRWDGTDEPAWLYAAGTGAVLVLATRPIRTILDRRRASSLTVSFVVRLAAVFLIGMSGLLAGPLFGFLVALTMAMALGIEAALCAQVLGVPVDATAWCRAFARSPLHVGVIGAIVGSVLNIGTEQALVVGVTVYLLTVMWMLGGIVCAALVERVRTDLEGEQRSAVDAAIADGHRQSAHWLHDDVSSELKLVQLRLRTTGDTPHSADDVAQQLFDLDHRLRLRQLDELFASGSVSLAEVLQPFVRRAQSQGVEITAVPTFDDASVLVSPATGRLFARAVSIVTTNAIVAGACRLAIAVTSDAEAITLTVTDDAGGFELADVPAGRGLWQLRESLGDPDAVRVERSPGGDGSGGGSIVTVRIPRRVVHGRAAPAAG